MREAYTEVMEHLSLTEVERARIVRGLRRRARAKRMRRWSGLAACLVVAVAVCAVALPQLREPPVQVVPDFVEAADAAELSELVGFPVAQAEELPFEVVDTSWTALWHELAETVYTGPNGQTATLRQGQGTDDVSGDYWHTGTILPNKASGHRFGDEVDEIRSFAVADQRTMEQVERVWAPPCRELLLTDAVRTRAAALGREHPQLRELTDKLAEGIPVADLDPAARAGWTAEQWVRAEAAGLLVLAMWYLRRVEGRIADVI